MTSRNVINKEKQYYKMITCIDENGRELIIKDDTTLIISGIERYYEIEHINNGHKLILSVFNENKSDFENAVIKLPEKDFRKVVKMKYPDYFRFDFSEIIPIILCCIAFIFIPIAAFCLLPLYIAICVLCFAYVILFRFVLK